MAAIPFYLYPGRADFLARAPELAKVLMARAARDGKDWDKWLDLGASIEVIRQLADGDTPGLLAAVLNNSHLLIYSVGSLWFDPTKVWLIEQFFMRIDRGPTSQALVDIDDLARSHGAHGIIMATSLAANDEALGRLYARHGYTPQSSQHFKEL